MRCLCVVIATSGMLFAAWTPSCQAGTASAAPRPVGFKPLRYAYSAPHGYRPHSAYTSLAPYAPLPYAYGLPPQYGSPHYAYGAPSSDRPEYGPALPGYRPSPNYGLPSRAYDSPPYGMAHDTTARFKAWSEIANSLAEALLQVRTASPHDQSEFGSPSTAHPR